MVFLVWIALIVATAVVASQRNLSVGLYCVLAIFLGPLALIIALLAAPPRTEVSAGSLPAARAEISLLRDTLSRVESRIRLLEDRLNQSEGVGVTSASVGDALPAEPSHASRPQPVEREGLEMAFGRYWLNRIGVVLFVVGMGFFISYSLHSMPKVMKIFSGFILSGVFFFWGNYLEKFPQYRKIGWGILGGAWGLLYLTTFAMHYITATRIIPDPLVELLLLAVVTSVVVGYNLKYRSQTVTGLTFLLAFLTAGFGGVEVSILVYWTAVIMAAVYLACRLQWPLFLIFAVVSAWVMHAGWMNTGGLGLIGGLSTPLELFQLKVLLGMAMITWFLFCKGLLFLPFRNRDEERYVIIGTLVNAGMFAFIGEGILRRLYFWGSSADAKIAAFLLGLGLLHLLLAWGARICGKPRLIVVNTAVAFFMAGLAALAHLSQAQVALLWLLEAVGLFFLGVYYQERWFRGASMAVSLLVTARLFVVDYHSSLVYSLAGLDVKHKVLAVGLSAAAFFLIGTLARKPAYARRMTAGEVDLFSCAPIFSAVLVTILLGGEVAARWRTLGWTIEGVLLLALGFFLNQRVTRVCALVVFSLAVLRLLVIDMAGLNTLYRIFAFLGLGAVLVAASFIYTRFAIPRTPRAESPG